MITTYQDSSRREDLGKNKGIKTHWSAIKKCKKHGVFHRNGKCPNKK